MYPRDNTDWTDVVIDLKWANFVCCDGYSFNSLPNGKGIRCKGCGDRYYWTSDSAFTRNQNIDFKTGLNILRLLRKLFIQNDSRPTYTELSIETNDISEGRIHGWFEKIFSTLPAELKTERIPVPEQWFKPEDRSRELYVGLYNLLFYEYGARPVNEVLSILLKGNYSNDLFKFRRFFG